MFNEPSDQPRREPNFSPSPAPTENEFQPSGGQAQYPTGASFQQQAPIQSQPSVQNLRRPSCVTLTFLVFLFLVAVQGLNLLGSLVTLDFLGLAVSVGLLFAYSAIAYGLFEMYRWAVNLVLIYSAMSIAQNAIFFSYFAILSDEHLTNSFSRTIFYLMWMAMGVLVIAIYAGVIWWYNKTRQYFRDNDLFPNRPRLENSLYILFMVTMTVSIVVAVVQMPETIELMEPQFEQLNNPPSQ